MYQRWRRGQAGDSQVFDDRWNEGKEEREVAWVRVECGLRESGWEEARVEMGKRL